MRYGCASPETYGIKGSYDDSVYPCQTREEYVKRYKK